jgi:hypothetical protein
LNPKHHHYANSNIDPERPTLKGVDKDYFQIR